MQFQLGAMIVIGPLQMRLGQILALIENYAQLDHGCFFLYESPQGEISVPMHAFEFHFDTPESHSEHDLAVLELKMGNF